MQRSLSKYLCAIASIVAGGLLSPPALAADAALSPSERRDLLADAQAAFDKANALSQSNPDQAVKVYRDAASLYQALIADGLQNGKLYYNLGNAYLQIGEIGQAILNYRRAEELIGNDPQLQANLRYARSLRRTQIESTGGREVLHTIFFWHYATSTSTRFLVGIVAYVLFWLALTARIFVRQPGLKLLAGAMGVLWIATGISVGVDTYHDLAVHEGVTTAADIVVRKGNGEAYEPQFKESIHEGVEFTVLDQRTGWYEIELPDGSIGWIRADQAEII